MADDSAALAMVAERLRSIDNQMQEDRRTSSASRQRMYDKLENTDNNIEKLAVRVDALERSLTSISPTVTEFLAYKEQVRGAGKLGRFLWTLGGFILTAAASVAATYAWLASFFTMPKA